MAQNIYDDPDVFAAYSRLPRATQGLDGAPEWPAMRALLPDLEGLTVIDLGCGFGEFCRWARDEGAAKVIGVDSSENMMQRAWEEDVFGLSLALADIEDMRWPEAEFDLAYSSLVFQHVEELAALLAHLHRAVKPGGQLLFSAEPQRNLDSLRDLVTSAGFAIEQADEIAPDGQPILIVSARR